MKIIEQAIRFPVTTAVGVILLVLFGTISLFRLPVQLTPNVDDPVITITTIWPGASPAEVEREIVQEQEDQLKSLEGLIKMESSSSDSSGSIKLTFQVGTDMDTALLRASNRLDQVPEYPADADKPVLTSTDVNSTAVAWFALTPLAENGFEGDIDTVYDMLDNLVVPEFERVPGIGSSNIFGGREHEMHVIVDPAKLAARQLTVNEVAAALDRENSDFSGGDFAEGKRRYVVRTVGEYQSTADIEDVVVAVRNGVPVYLRDVGRAELGFRKAVVSVFNKGQPALAINATKEPDSNVIEVVEGLLAALERVNADTLRPAGLQLTTVYVETEYIDSAIDLVQQSLMIGGLFAIIVLLLYLRSGTSTLVIAVAIPISIVGAFLGMLAWGRTLNVISLAGLAFAVGMVVDNSIVVLENIYRHRQMGKSRKVAAFEGAREVWGAVLASTLTTIAVFVPVVFMQEEVGQLFGDIALAISFAVALSLIIAITVIPSMSAKMLGGARRATGAHGNLWGLAPKFAAVGAAVASIVYKMTGSVLLRLAVVVGFTAAALFGSWALMPQMEYLPLGNQNFVFGLLLPPPGYSLKEMAGFDRPISEGLQHLWEHEPESPEADAQPAGGVREHFYVALTSMAFMGGKATDGQRVRELLPEYRKAASGIPGAIFVINQPSLFERGQGAGRTIDIEIRGPDLIKLIDIGSQVFMQVMQKLPDSQARPIPSLDLGNPEVRIETHRRRAAELGLTHRDLGYAVSVLVDGAKASEYQFEGKEIDLRLKGEESVAHRTHLLEQIPIATPTGNLVTLGSVADISVTNGPVQINHRERVRTITIQVTPSDRMPLETAMSIVDDEIIAPLHQSGQLAGPYSARLSGTADKLSQAARSIRANLALALIITYLLLAALFESFLYPLVILFSVPLAAFGGFIGLFLVSNLIAYQHLDVLTMLGFVILIGTVVNNAILIVHQSLNHMRFEEMPARESIRESVRNRMRPIFMSVSTSVCGMLPLILFPGAGSELYRGLGSVVVGGLIVSTLFTLFLVPALLSLALDARAALVALFRRRVGGGERPAEG